MSSTRGHSKQDKEKQKLIERLAKVAEAEIAGKAAEEEEKKKEKKRLLKAENDRKTNLWI